VTPTRDIDDDSGIEFGEDLMRVAGRLRDARPRPSGAFESVLRARVEALSHSPLGPRHARQMMIVFGLAGALLLAVGALFTLL
jgi:hypothetical protein